MSCAVHGCNEIIKARKLCNKHYQRYMKHRDVGINYRERMNRLLVNDISTWTKPLITNYEVQALREIFSGGKHQGCLRVNYNAAMVND